MNENQSELQNQVEQQVTLSELEEGVHLPDERPRRKRRKKILLALLALLLLVAVTAVSGYYLLRGERVDVRANKKLPEKVTSGKDIKQAAFDSISGSLTGPVKTPSPGQLNNSGSTQQQTARSASESTTTALAADRTETVSVPFQPGIAATLAPPPEALLTKGSTPGSVQQRNTEKSTQSASAASANTSASKPNATQSVRFAPVAHKVENTKDDSGNITLSTSPVKNSVADKNRCSGKV